MWLSTIRVKVQPGKADELAQRWKDFYGPHAREWAGFQHAYHALDRATNTALAVALWSEKPDEAQLGPAMQEFASQSRHLVVEPPTLEWREVLQQF